MKWIIVLAFYSIVPVQYFILRNESKPKKNLILGATLPWAAQQDQEVLQVCAAFRRTLGLTFLLLTAAAVPALFLPGLAVPLTYLFFWLIAAILLPFVVYARANGRLRRLKEDRGWSRQLETTATVVDLNAVADGAHSAPDWLFVPPLLVSLIPLVWTLIFDRTAPDFWGILLGCGCVAATIVVCWIIYHVAVRKRADVVNDNSDLNTALSRIRRQNLGRAMLWLSYLTALFNLWLWRTTYHTMALLAGSLVYCAALLIIATYMEFKVRDLQAKLTAQVPQGNIVDEDRWWLWGLLYYNPNDRSLIVNNRTGMNTTCNLGHPAGKVLMGAAVLVLLLMPFLGFWLVAEERTPVTMTVTEQALVMTHTRTEYEVPLEDITSVELLETMPPARRVMGTGMDDLLKGNFVLYEDQGAQICLNPQAPPFLLIETAEGETYLFGSEDGAQTRSVYAALQGT